MFSAYKIEKGSLKKYIGLDSHAVVPDGVIRIKEGAFKGRPKLTAVTIADSVTSIESWAFDRCPNLTAVMIPASVTKIRGDAFFECPGTTIVCPENSYAHRYAVKNHRAYLFDYQYEAFGGVIPPGIEMLSSPFLADEEQPYVFVSYSHKDRDTVLKTIKTLYESGWKIWYDEGLTIGDRYDETLEEHVRNCAAFLLFVTENSLRSLYIRENEIPWAVGYNKPVIKCIMGKGLDYEISEGSVLDTVPPSGIGSALEKVDGLTKGGRREAKGITVAVDPAARETQAGNGFAYCLYAQDSAVTAKSILLEVRKSGCTLYNAVENGADGEKLQSSACLTVLLNKAFLADAGLTGLLTQEYEAQKDIAVCLLEDIEDDDLPAELIGLHRMQWLNFAHGMNLDMITKLVRHLQKRGCRNAAVLPGFEYKKAKNGIVITRYTGMAPEPAIDAAYGGVPVVGIADNAFKNCVHVTKAVLPESVTFIGKNAFSGCTGLTAVSVPEGLTEIGDYAFEDCKNLISINIPDSITVIGEGAFHNCLGLRSITVPGRVDRIGRSAFKSCQRLESVRIGNGVRQIGESAFSYCMGLKTVEIPDSVTDIEDDAFLSTDLTAVAIPESVVRIGAGAFSHCSKLVSVTMPAGLTKIEKEAFCCTGLVSAVIPDSVTEIGSRAFLSCEKMTSVHIPDEVRIIRDEAFRYCHNLRSITIPDSVEIMEDDVFALCPDLTVNCSPGSAAWKYCEENDIRKVWRKNG